MQHWVEETDPEWTMDQTIFRAVPGFVTYSKAVVIDGLITYGAVVLSG